MKRIFFTLVRLSSWVMLSPSVMRTMERIEQAVAFVCGRGAGSGWDLDGEARVASKCVQPSGGVVLDIGANDGRWSIEVHRRLPFGNTRFILCECVPPVIDILKSRTENIPEFVIVPYAISNEVGETVCFAPSRGSGLGSLYERRDTSVSQEEYKQWHVHATTVDELLRDHGIANVDYMKLDVEGHEMAVLQGAKQALTQNRIKAIQFEFGSANVNSRTYFRDFWTCLSNFGFEVFRMLPGGRMYRVKAYRDEMEYFRGATNYVAIRQPT